jgi:predicted PurR-regulated permease PerM
MKSSQKIALGFAAVLGFILLYLLEPVWEPFLIAALLAYLGDPLVNRLMKLKISRTMAALIVFLLIMFAIVSVFLFVVPLLARQITLLINRLPDLIVWIQQTAVPWIKEHTGVSISFDLKQLKMVIAQHWQQVGNVAAVVWTALSSSGLALLAWLTKLLLIPVVTFYLLRDWESLIKGIQQLLPRKIEPTVVKLVKECNEVLSAFFRGQLLVMLALSIIYSIGLAITGLDTAVLLGVMSGALTIVPYLGVTIGVVVSGIAAFIQFHDWIHVMYVLIVFAIGHVLENMVLTPWLVGDRIGLHPVAVLFAVLAGGHLFGFTGVLLALPVAAVIMVLIRHLKKKYIGSELYKI